MKGDDGTGSVLRAADVGAARATGVGGDDEASLREVLGGENAPRDVSTDENDVREAETDDEDIRVELLDADETDGGRGVDERSPERAAAMMALRSACGSVRAEAGDDAAVEDVESANDARAVEPDLRPDDVAADAYRT